MLGNGSTVKRRKAKARYTVFKYLRLSDVLPLIGEVETSVFGGHNVNTNSLRLQTFKNKGVNCVKCGAKGMFFALETTDPDFKFDKQPHLNLYAMRDDGLIVLMTKDHIIPVSKQGRNLLENLQPMCEICNSEKSNTIEENNTCF